MAKQNIDPLIAGGFGFSSLLGNQIIEADERAAFGVCHMGLIMDEARKAGMHVMAPNAGAFVALIALGPTNAFAFVRQGQTQ